VLKCLGLLITFAIVHFSDAFDFIYDLSVLYEEFPPVRLNGVLLTRLLLKSFNTSICILASHSDGHLRDVSALELLGSSFHLLY
jgi:hypothetical protein